MVQAFLTLIQADLRPVSHLQYTYRGYRSDLECEAGQLEVFLTQIQADLRPASHLDSTYRGQMRLRM